MNKSSSGVDRQQDGLTHAFDVVDVEHALEDVERAPSVLLRTSGGTSHHREPRAHDAAAGAAAGLPPLSPASRAETPLLPRTATTVRHAGGGGGGRDRTSIMSNPAALASGVMYTVCSAGLTLLNKQVLARYEFTALHALLCLHCAVAVALVRVAAAAGLATLEPLSWDTVRLWAPVNVIFVGMLATNFYALRLVGVGMVSVLKNLSNFFILAGDYVLFRRTYSWHVWACLALMLMSVAAGGATDAAFSWVGYGWQMANNALTAAYALYLSRVTERLSVGGGERRPLNQLSMVYYNNALSLPLTAALVIVSGELRGFWAQPAIYDRGFQALAVISGVLGFGVSASSIAFVSLTTATFYSLVGSFNKVAVAGLGMWWFAEPTEPRNVASIAAGLLAGAVLPFVKMRSAMGGAGAGGGGGGGGRSSIGGAKPS